MSPNSNTIQNKTKEYSKKNNLLRIQVHNTIKRGVWASRKGVCRWRLMDI